MHIPEIHLKAILVTLSNLPPLATRCILASYLFKQLSPLVPSQSSNGKFLAFRNFVGISWNASFPIRVMIFLMLAVFHLARVVSQSHCITTYKGAEKKLLSLQTSYVVTVSVQALVHL